MTTQEKEEIVFDRKLPIAGFPVTESTPGDLAAYLLTILEYRKKITLLFANSNFIVKCKRLIGQMHDDSVLIVNDGLGMDIVAQTFYGGRFKANLNGTDFTPYLFHRSDRPLCVFLFGGKPNVVKKAAIYVERKFRQVVVGYCDGYTQMETEDLIAKINNSGADILLVALGNPLQEEWILKNREVLHTPIVSGVGALFDFWAGDKPRAPKTIQKIRMEWLYRLYLEPRRLMRRYTIDILIFFAECYKYHKANSHSNNPLKR